MESHKEQGVKQTLHDYSLTFKLALVVIPPFLGAFKSRIFPYFESRRFYMKTSRFSDTQIIAILKQASIAIPNSISLEAGQRGLLPLPARACR